MPSETNPSGKMSKQNKCQSSGFRATQNKFKERGYKHYGLEMSPNANLKWLLQYQRYKNTIGLHPGGWSEYWPTGAQRVIGASSEYLEKLLDLEEVCRYIALNGQGHISKALKVRMEKLGLLRDELADSDSQA